MHRTAAGTMQEAGNIFRSPGDLEAQRGDGVVRRQIEAAMRLRAIRSLLRQFAAQS